MVLRSLSPTMLRGQQRLRVGKTHRTFQSPKVGDLDLPLIRLTAELNFKLQSSQQAPGQEQ